jgi:hypothetical protein
MCNFHSGWVQAAAESNEMPPGAHACMRRASYALVDRLARSRSPEPDQAEHDDGVQNPVREASPKELMRRETVHRFAAQIDTARVLKQYPQMELHVLGELLAKNVVG